MSMARSRGSPQSRPSRSHVALQHLLLGHPVELAAQLARVALQPVEDDAPPAHDLGGVVVDLAVPQRSAR